MYENFLFDKNPSSKNFVLLFAVRKIKITLIQLVTHVFCMYSAFALTNSNTECMQKQCKRSLEDCGYKKVT